MTSSTQLQLKLSELRETINSFPDDGDTSELDKLTNEHVDTERRYRAALVTESSSDSTRKPSGDGESTEFRSLIERASLGRMLAGIADDAQGAGAERELRQARNLPDSYIPWEMLEQRAAVAVSGDEEGSAKSWVRRVFPRSAMAATGVEMITADVGEQLVPIVGTGITIGEPGRTVAQGQSSPTATVDTLSPRRFTGNWPVAREDMAKWSMLEDAFRVDAMSALQDALDIDVLTKTNKGLLTTAADPDPTPATPAAATPAATFLSDVYGAVDGRFANAINEISLLLGPESYAYAGGLVFDTGSGMTVVDKLQSIGVSVFVTDNVGAYANNRQEALVTAGPPRRNGVAATWGGIEVIRDDVTSADAGLVNFHVLAMFDFEVVRKGPYHRTRYRRS